MKSSSPMFMVSPLTCVWLDVEGGAERVLVPLNRCAVLSQRTVSLTCLHAWGRDASAWRHDVYPPLLLPVLLPLFEKVREVCAYCHRFCFLMHARFLPWRSHPRRIQAPLALSALVAARLLASTAATTEGSRWDVRQAEKTLLRYYGAARSCMVVASPAFLQMRATKDASALVRTQLFPCPIEPTSSIPATGASPPPPQPGAFPTPRAKGNDVGEGLQTSEGAASPTAAITVPAAASVCSTLFSGSLYREIVGYRLLNNRYSTAIDSSHKNGDNREVPFGRVSEEIDAVWRAESTACKDIRRPTREEGAGNTSCCSSGDSSPKSPIVPSARVLFLVLCSVTHEQAPVSENFRRIARHVEALLPQHPAYHHCPRRLTTIWVGALPLPRGPPHGEDLRIGTSSSSLCFSEGSLYTLNSVLLCLEDLPPVEGVQRRVLVLSEGYQHPRLIAQMQGGRSAVEVARGGQTTQHVVEVFPGVVSGHLSEKEVDAFVRYVICMLMK